MNFKTETDAAQNLIQIWLSEGLSIGRVLIEKIYGGTGSISEKTEALYTELKERAEAATSNYSATGDPL